MTKHSYDKEFKEQAVQYYLDNKDHMTMNEISKNLGIGASGTIPCQVDTYKNENTIFLIRPNRGNIPPRFGHFF